MALAQERPTAGGARPVIWAVAGLGLALALAGAQAYRGGSGRDIAIPPAALAGLVLLVLAARRFDLFVAALLVVRPAVDAVNAGSSRAADPAAAIAVLFILASLVWLAARRAAGEDVPLSGVSQAALLLLGAGVVSIAGSSQPLQTAAEVLRVGAVVMMLIVLEQLLADRSKLRLVLSAAFVSAVIPIAVAGVQALTRKGGFADVSFYRVQGTFTYPSPFASYLAFVGVMAAALIPHVRGRVRFALLVLLIADVVALLLTYTRVAWIALVVGLLVVGALQSKKLLAGLVIALLAVVVAAPSVTARFSDLSESRTAAGYSGNSLIWRFEYWGETLSLVTERPVTGIGLGEVRQSTDQQKAPHNDYLRAYVEMGVIGVLAYVAFLVSMAVVARRALRRAPPGLERAIAVGFAGCLTVLLTLSITANVISQPVILWTFAVFAAAAVAVSRRPGADRSDTRQPVGVDA